MSLRRRQRSLALPAGVLALVLAALLLAAAVPAAAVQIPATSAEAFPHPRFSNDPPFNAIDGSTATFTWTTETLNTDAPSYLAIAFASSQVNRLRIFKTNETGTVPATAAKNLVIQYTTGSGPLVSRSWSNVPNLTNGNLNEGFFGAEPLTASAVNRDGTVFGDNHNNSFASLAFDTVQATGLRIGFSPVTTSGTCSTNLTGPCNHYRVAEFQAHFDSSGSPTPTPTPGPQSGVRITSIEGTGVRVRARNTGTGAVRVLGEGDVVQPGEEIFVIGGSDAEVEAKDSQDNQVTMQSTSQVQSCGNAADEGLGGGTIQYEGSVVPGAGGLLNPAFGNTCGSAEIDSSAGSGTQAVENGTAPSFALTPETQVQVRGRARVTRDPRRGQTTVSNLRGSVNVTPTNTSLRGLRLTPGRQVRVTRTSISPPFALVPDLLNEIPSPRQVRAGPATVTAPSRISLRSLKLSKCVRVAVSSTRPARVLVTIFSGRRSVRLFGQRLVVFAAAGRRTTCILVPRRAKTFNVRTPLRFAVGYALGARSRPGQRSAPPVIRPIRLVP